MVVGNGLGSSAIKVTRQTDDATAAQLLSSLDSTFDSQLLAYFNHTNGNYPLALGVLVLGILAFFGTRKLLKKKPNESV